jgi:hypothetical protein
MLKRSVRQSLTSYTDFGAEVNAMPGGAQEADEPERARTTSPATKSGAAAGPGQT